MSRKPPRQARPLLRRPRARRPRAAGRHPAPGGVPRRAVGRERGPHLQQEPQHPARLLQVPRAAREPARRPDAGDRAGARRDVYRTTFNNDQVRAIVASQDELRDRVALRLLLDYGLRKGALKAIQFKHFDHHRKRLTVFTKGEKVRELPIPHPDVLVRPRAADPRVRGAAEPLPAAAADDAGVPLRARQGGRVQIHRFPEKPMGDHGLHDWWYALPRAGRDRRARDDQRRADAQGPPHRRPARSRRDRQPQGGPEAARPRVDLRRPATSTPTGTSTSWRRRCGLVLEDED